MKRITIINPNSDAAMTAMVNRRLDILRQSDAPELVCLTLQGAPSAIETAEHCRQVVEPLLKLASTLDASDAIVIACFSDPGLSELRGQTSRPVFGFCEAAVSTALGLGGPYGILTNLIDDIPEEMAYLKTIGLERRLAGIEAIGVPVSAIAQTPDMLARMVDCVSRLRQNGARSAILGCAGFSAFAPDLSRATGINIIDPTIAAVALAISAIAY